MSRIVIFANGLLNDPDSLRQHLRPTDRIFCADGGTYHALSLGLTPEVIVGDLDSLSAEMLTNLSTKGVTVQRYPPDKDQTDLELTMALALSHNPQAVLLMGALGGRLDQTLANILLMTRPEYADITLTLVDGRQRATLLRAQQTLTVAGQAGDTLSLIPLTPTVAGVTLKDVQWPLTEAQLSFGSSYTVSNALTGQQARVKIGTGMVLVIHISCETSE